MSLSLKDIVNFLILFFILLNAATFEEAIAQDSIGKVIMLLDLNGTEQDDEGAPIANSLGKAIYSKTAPIITSGYTIERYLQNSTITKDEYEGLKNKTFEYIDKTSEYIDKTSEKIQIAKQYDPQSTILYTEIDKYGHKKSSTFITYAAYLKILEDNLTKANDLLSKNKDTLHPGQWIFREKPMLITSDEWFVYKKNDSNVFLLIPKKYLKLRLKKEAPYSSTDIKKIGFDISVCTDITDQVHKFCANLPENKADFELKYPSALKPPVKKEAKTNINDITRLFVMLPPVVEPPKNLINLILTKFLPISPISPIIRWLILLDGHGSSATYQDLKKTYERVCHNALIEEKSIKIQSSIIEIISENIGYFTKGLETIKTGGTYTYMEGGETLEYTQKKLEEELEEAQKKLQKAQQEKEKHIKGLQQDLDEKKDLEIKLKLAEKWVSANNATIAGLSFKDFQKLLIFFNTHICVAFLYYSSCYAGGYNKALVNEILKNIFANFMVAAGALTDKVVLSQPWKSWHLDSMKDESLKLGFDADLEKYFDELEKYFTFEPTKEAVLKKVQKKASIEKALKHLTQVNKPAGWANDAPFIRLPNGDSFSAVGVDQKIYCLTSAQEKIHVLEGTPFDLSKKKGIYLLASYITTPVMISGATFFSITSPPVEVLVKKVGKIDGKTVGEAELYISKKFIPTHYFKKITSSAHTFSGEVARHFLAGLGIYTTRFLIEELHGKEFQYDIPVITNVIIQGERPGNVTISWIQNDKGYKKNVVLEEQKRQMPGYIWPGDEKYENAFEYDIESNRKAIDEVYDTSIPKDTILKEFNELKMNLKKAIKHEDVDKGVATNKSFFEKLFETFKGDLTKLVKEDPNKTDSEGKTALHHAILKPLSPTFTEETRVKLIKMLLARGADVTKQDKNKKTAFDLVLETKNIPVLRIFLIFHPELRTSKEAELLLKADAETKKPCDLLLESLNKVVKKLRDLSSVLEKIGDNA